MAHVIRIKSGDIEVFEAFDETADGFLKLVSEHMGGEAERWFREFLDEYREDMRNYRKLQLTMERVEDMLR